MNPRVSVLAVTLSLAFAAARISAPGSSAQGEPALHPRAQSGNQTKPRSAAPDTGCTAYLPATKAASYPDDENRGSADKILRTFFSGTHPDGARTVIALAPDPRHTNLSLMFDREITILQQAAQEEGYEYNSSWMPWATDEPQALDSLADRQDKADLVSGRESCPGVILFRKRLNSSEKPADQAAMAYQNALIVFVVGEQATGGLNEEQWATAVQWLNHNPYAAGGDGVLRVLGPTFTGSLVSLERDLQTVFTGGSTPPPSFTRARVFSGSVTGCSAIDWFQRQSRQLAGGNKVIFGTFQESDSVHIFRFLDYLREQGTDLKDVAILSEDETAYAALPKPHENPQPAANDSSCDFPFARDDRPLHLVYPRDISALRDAYQKESIFDLSAVASSKGSARPILSDEVGQGAAGKISDAVPNYSGSVLALSQEAYLFGVVSFMRAHHTRYLLLRCTNPLDFLFLTRFFHRAYPQARIVTVGSDLLFRREIDTTEFRGVLSLSSYPLLPLDQHWSRITEEPWEDEPHDHLVFESHLQEGMYIAARYLLRDDAASGVPLQIDRAIPTPDYADPFWLAQNPLGSDGISTHPPTWLTAVGRDGYWPVAVLNRNTNADRLDLPEDWKSWRHLPPSPPAPQSTMVQLIAQPRLQHYELQTSPSGRIDPAPPVAVSKSLLLGLPFPWLICGILSLSLAAYQLWGLSRGTRHVSDGLFSVFYSAADPSHTLLLGISCALAILPLCELTAVAAIPAQINSIAGSGFKIDFAIVLTVLMGVWTAWTLFFRGRRQHRRYAFAGLACFLVPLALLLGVYSIAFQAGLNDANNAPLFYRMTHLTDGVSPLLPALLITLGFYLWTWQAMAGNLILTRGCPTLPEVEKVSLRRPHRLRKFYHWLIGFHPQSTGTGTNLLPSAAYRIGADLGRRIVKLASPLCVSPRIVVVPALLLVAALLCILPNNLPLLSLEGRTFNWVINGTLVLALLFTAAEASRLYSTWLALRKLLHALARLRLRRTLARLRPIASHSIWGVSGNVRRFQYSLFKQQLDAANRLILLTRSSGYLVQLKSYGDAFTHRAESGIETGSRWDEMVHPAGRPPRLMRQVLADAVAEVYTFLQIQWNRETISLNLDSDLTGESEKADQDALAIPLSREPAVQAAEEFVCYHYIAFIQNIVARMRTMTLSMICLFLAACLAISFYPFVPRTEIAVWMVLNLFFIGAAVAYVYAGMERNEILSYIANSKPGQLGAAFWLRMAGFLAVPALGVLTTQFPSINDTVLQWLQPGLDAIK